MSHAAIAKESGLRSRLLMLMLVPLQHLKQTIVDRSRRVKARRMVLLEALELGNRRQLFLVACDEHRFLVGAGGDQIGTVVAMPAPAAVPGESGTQSTATGGASGSKLEPACLRRPGFEAAGTHGLQLIRRGGERLGQTGTPKGNEAGKEQ